MFLWWKATNERGRIWRWSLAVLMWLTQPLGSLGAQAGEQTSHKELDRGLVSPRKTTECPPCSQRGIMRRHQPCPGPVHSPRGPRSTNCPHAVGARTPDTRLLVGNVGERPQVEKCQVSL